MGARCCRRHPVCADQRLARRRGSGGVGGIVFGQDARPFVIGLDRLQLLQLDNGGKTVTIERLADAFNIQQIQASLELSSSGPATADERTLIIRNQSSVNHLSRSGNISILPPDANLVFDNAAGALTFADGIISGGDPAANNRMTLTKRGAGTVQLGGANTYRGTTEVQEGVLQLGQNGGIAHLMVYDFESSNGGLVGSIALVRENADLRDSLTIVKINESPVDRTFAFTSDVPGHASFSIATIGGTGAVTFAPLAAGTYRVHEMVPAGWLLTEATCDNGDRPDAVTLGFGETVTCFLFNDLGPDQSGGNIRPRNIERWQRQELACPLLPQALAFVLIDSCPTAMHILHRRDLDGKRTMDDAAYWLAAQLLVAELNLAANARWCPAALDAMAEANALLTQLHFTGRGTYLLPKSVNLARRQALSLADTLIAYNNDRLCPRP